MKSRALIGMVVGVWIGIMGVTNAFAGERYEPGKNGVDWENEVIYATAYSGVDMNRMTSRGQAKQEALTQAYDLACVQLNKIINGLSINSQRLYELSSTQDNILRTETKGMIYNARTKYQNVTWNKFKGQDQPEAEVTVCLDFRSREKKRGDKAHTVSGLAKPIVEYEARLAKTESQLPRFDQKTVKTGVVYTSLIIDARATDLTPVCVPKILTSDGAKELYGVRSVDLYRLGKRLPVHYTDTVEKARKSARAGSNPLIIKASESKGLRKGDVVVSENDAKKILTADVDTKFLSESKVVMVVNSAQL